MAKSEFDLTGDFNSVVNRIKEDILSGSTSASLEEISLWQNGSVKCATMVFERYSYFWGNRLSLSVVVISDGSDLHVTGITAGGSNAVFFKINTVGEESFLDKFDNVMNDIINE